MVWNQYDVELASVLRDTKMYADNPKFIPGLIVNIRLRLLLWKIRRLKRKVGETNG